MKRNLRTFDNIQPIKFIPDIDFDRDNIKCVDLQPNKKKTLLLLENVLSITECQFLRENSYSYYQPLSEEFDKKERQASRVMALDENFARVLLERIFPHLPIKNDEIPCGFGTSGKWEIDRINFCFRYIKYTNPSIGFLPHRDATFIDDEDHRSVLTIIIYLNEDFTGGKTTFFKPLHKRSRLDIVSDEMNNGVKIKFQYQPKTGCCVIFNHNMIHSGDPLLMGEKYIIRTDLIYKRTKKPIDYSYDWLCDPYYHQAIFLYREAINQELDGNLEHASILYQQQLAIRQTA